MGTQSKNAYRPPTPRIRDNMNKVMRYFAAREVEGEELSKEEIARQKGERASLQGAAKRLEPEEIRDGRKSVAQVAKEQFDALITMQTSIVVNNPFEHDGIPPLPKKDVENMEHDLLSDSIVQELCRMIVEDQVSVEIAAMGVGIPPATIREYMEVGQADLAAGMWTRKAILAKVAMQATYEVIRESMAAVRKLPVGWQNHAFAMERMFPEIFSEKRNSRKEQQHSAALESLARQLGSAMSTPLPLPKTKS